ncbi:MAG TPA: transcriptional repressor [bacterium]|jgi:Fur family ferric uptake transcriptional regulator
MTAQRRAVREAMAALGCARSAEEIHARARRAHRRLGLVTVYRTLAALVRDGLAQPIHVGDGRTRYELTEEGRHHHHLICVSCGSVARLEGCVLPSVARAAAGHRFTVTGHRLELFGYCVRCQTGA